MSLSDDSVTRGNCTTARRQASLQQPKAWIVVKGREIRGINNISYPIRMCHYNKL